VEVVFLVVGYLSLQVLLYWKFVEGFCLVVLATSRD